MLVSWELQALAHNSRHECAIPGSQREIFVSCIFFLKMVVPIIPKAVSQSLVSEASIIKAWGNRVKMVRSSVHGWLLTPFILCHLLPETRLLFQLHSHGAPRCTSDHPGTPHLLCHSPPLVDEGTMHLLRYLTFKGISWVSVRGVICHLWQT